MRSKAAPKDSADAPKGVAARSDAPIEARSNRAWTRALHSHGGLTLATIGTIAAAIATMSTCRQTNAVLADRTTPYKIALFQTRTDEFRKFVPAGQRFDASFRKALFVIPIFMETDGDARKQTDAQLEAATAKVGFMIDEYTVFSNEVEANSIGWEPETTTAMNEVREAAHGAMRCYFAFGPEARPNMPPEYWAGVRARAAAECPKTRAWVIRLDEALLRTRNLMSNDIKAVTLPTE